MNEQYEDLLKDLPGMRFYTDAFIRYQYGDVDGKGIYVMRRKMGQNIGNAITDANEFFQSQEIRASGMLVGVAIKLDAVILTAEEHQRSIIEAYKKGFSDGMSGSMWVRP